MVNKKFFLHRKIDSKFDIFLLELRDRSKILNVSRDGSFTRQITLGAFENV